MPAMTTVSPSNFKVNAVTAATAAVALSSALYNVDSFVPNSYYQLPEDFDIPYSARLHLQDINKLDLELIDKAETLYGFVKKLSTNTVDLDPKIVDLVNDNFWDLI